MLPLCRSLINIYTWCIKICCNQRPNTQHSDTSTTPPLDNTSTATMPPKKKGKKDDAEEQKKKEEEGVNKAAAAAAAEEEAALQAAEEAAMRKMEDLTARWIPSHLYLSIYLYCNIYHHSTLLPAWTT